MSPFVEASEFWPYLLLFGCALLGLVIGSFLNVVVYRLPIMMELEWRSHLSELDESDFTPPPHAPGKGFNLWWPPSACPQCGHRIAAWENVPIVSYLWLRGRCRSCGAVISKRYPFVEAFVAVVSVVVAWTFGPTWACVAALIFSWTLIALALIDIDHQLLPDSLTIPLLWAGLLISLFSIDGEPILADVESSVIGAVAGYMSLWSVYHLFKLLTGKDGMGYGDFKLLAALGAWLGWQSLPLIILLSAIVGSIIGVAMIAVGGRSRHTPIPFGPYLAAAGWITLLWGDRLTSTYVQMVL
jgi:leader peptidase (prepilin peptidase)/N-methyltransferase